MEFVWGAGQTPIDPEEKAGLIPGIETMGELNDLEAANIAEADGWLRAPRRVMEPLSTQFLRAVHHQMFNRVWRWAGSYRRSDKNIGGSWNEIPMRMEEFVRNASEQVARRAYGPDELAARY